jgi:2-amino-4-hydroxy-6-hydroxymethyldihydropteridine diphosphokinase
MSLSKPAANAHRAYLAVGSNLGDRLANIAQALDGLGRAPGVFVASVSSVYVTDPVGKTDQPDFYNAVAELRSELGPEELLEACSGIEQRLGRVRTERWGPRTIDLDLLTYDELRLSSERLVLPHPRMLERAFVLIPLAEIAPELVIGGRTAAEWADGADPAGVRLLGFE